MATKEVARIEQNGNFRLNGIVDELLPQENLDILDHNYSFSNTGLTGTSINNIFCSIPEETCMVPDNLLESFGIDWRDPNNWSGHNSKITYDEKEDVLVIDGRADIDLNIAVPIFPNKKFMISMDFFQSKERISSFGTVDNVRLYAGGKIYDKDGNINPSHGEHYSGSWNYLIATNAYLNPSDGWVHRENHSNDGNPVTSISGNRNYSTWLSDKSRWYRPIIRANYTSANNTDADKNQIKVRNIRAWYSDEETDMNKPSLGLDFTNEVTNLIPSMPTKESGTQSNSSGEKIIVREDAYMPDGTQAILFRYNNQVLNNASSGPVVIAKTDKLPITHNKDYTFSMIVKSDKENIENFLHSNTLYRDLYKGNTRFEANTEYSTSDYIHIRDSYYLLFSKITIPDDSDIDGIVLKSYVYKSNIELVTGSWCLNEGKQVISAPYGGTTKKKSVTIPIKSTEDSDRDSYTIVGEFINLQPMTVNDSYDTGIDAHAELFSLIDTDGNELSFKWYRSSNGISNSPFFDQSNDDQSTNKWKVNTHMHVAGFGDNQLEYAKKYTWVFKSQRVSSGNGSYFRLYDEDYNMVLLVNNIPVNDPNVMPIIDKIRIGNDSKMWQHKLLSLNVYNGYIIDNGLLNHIKTRGTVTDGKYVERISETSEFEDFIKVDLLKDHKHLEYGDGILTIPSSVDSGYDLLPDLKDGFGTWGSINNFNSIVDTPYGKGIRFDSGALDFRTGNYNRDFIFHDFNDPQHYGKYANFSAWIYVTSDCDLNEVPIVGEGNAASRILYDMNNKGTWQHISFTKLIGNDTNKTVRFLLYPKKENPTDDNTFKGYCIYADIRIKFKTSEFVAPLMGDYNNYTISDSDRGLKLNLFKDYNLQWDKDFTITYLKFPVCDRHGYYDDYCIDSIGSNSNIPSGKGYRYYGKNKSTGKNYVYLSGKTDIPENRVNFNEYYNEWRRMTITYDSSINKIYITEQSKNDYYRRTFTANHNSSDHYVTGNDYDFSSGWDTQNSIGAIYRDFQISQKFSDETTVKNMFKQGAKLDKEGFKINGILQEGSL